MNMPRFTAETSLYKSYKNCSMGLSYTQLKDSMNVIPQQHTYTECGFCNPYTNLQGCRRKAMICRIEREPFSWHLAKKLSGLSVLRPLKIKCQWETVDIWLQSCGEFDPYPSPPDKF
jgi:hypothetical protein